MFMRYNGSTLGDFWGQWGLWGTLGLYGGSMRVYKGVLGSIMVLWGIFGGQWGF